MKLALTTLALSSALVSSAVAAVECDLQLQQDVRIEHQQVEVKDGARTLYRIDADNQLWIDNTAVALDTGVQHEVEQFADGLREELPRLVETVKRGLSLALDAVQQITTELFDNSEFAQDLSAYLEQLKRQFNQHFQHDNGVTFVSQDADNLLGDELEQELEAMISDSAVKLSGQMMAELGAAMMSGDGDFEQRVEAFAKQLEQKVEAIALRMEQQAQALEQNAGEHCERLQQLDESEQKILKAIPALEGAELIRI